MDSMDIMEIMEINVNMDIFDIMDIRDIMDIIDTVIITAWMAMAGAVSVLIYDKGEGGRPISNFG